MTRHNAGSFFINVNLTGLIMEKTMTPASATDAGFHYGVAIAERVQHTDDDAKSTAGCDCARECNECFCRRCARALALEVFENSKTDADFVNGIATTIMRQPDPETLWDAFEQGVDQGISYQLDLVPTDTWFARAMAGARAERARRAL